MTDPLPFAARTDKQGNSVDLKKIAAGAAAIAVAGTIGFAAAGTTAASADVDDYEIIDSFQTFPANGVNPANGQKSYRNTPCPAGKVVVGGGYEDLPYDGADYDIVQDMPVELPGGGYAWTLAVNNFRATSVTIRIYAACATGS